MSVPERERERDSIATRDCASRATATATATAFCLATLAIIIINNWVKIHLLFFCFTYISIWTTKNEQLFVFLCYKLFIIIFAHNLNSFVFCFFRFFAFFAFFDFDSRIVGRGGVLAGACLKCTISMEFLQYNLQLGTIRQQQKNIIKKLKKIININKNKKTQANCLH